MTKTLNNLIKYLLFIIAFLLPLIGESLLRFLFIGLIVLFFIVKRTYPSTTFALKKHGFLLVLTMIVLIYATVFSVSFEDSLNGFVKYGIGLLIMLIMQWVLTSKKDIFIFIQLFILSSTLIGGYGIYQFLFGQNRTYLLLDTALHPDIDIRVTSLMQNPNNLAEFLVLIIPLILAVILYKKQWMHKFIAISILGVLVVCLVVTYSRSGYVGFILAGVLFFVIVEARFLLLLPLGIGGLILWMPKGLESRIYSLVDSVSNYFTNPSMIKDSSVAYRLLIWNGAIKTLKEFYLYGVGLDNTVFALVYAFFSDTKVIAMHAHNLFLELLIEFGVVGFLVLFSFILSILWHSFKMSLYSTSRFTRLFTAAAVVGVLGLLLTGLGEHVWYYYKVFYASFVLLGLLMALYNNEYALREEVSS